MEFSTADFCMSYDGDYIAYTFEEVTLTKCINRKANVLWWTGNTYQFVGVLNNQGYVGGACAISDTDILALGWSRLDYKQVGDTTMTS